MLESSKGWSARSEVEEGQAEGQPVRVVLRPVEEVEGLQRSSRLEAPSQWEVPNASLLTEDPPYVSSCEGIW